MLSWKRMRRRGMARGRGESRDIGALSPPWRPFYGTMSAIDRQPTPHAGPHATATPGYKAGQVDPHAVTISGLVLEPSYGPTILGYPAIDSMGAMATELPKPGQFPYTRGLFPEGYRTRLWTMRQFAGFGSADDTNQRFKYLLDAAKGTRANTGLSTAFDLPTLMGRDSDDELSIGEVGKCGVAIDTIEDMHRLYADIPVGRGTVWPRSEEQTSELKP